MTSSLGSVICAVAIAVLNLLQTHPARCDFSPGTVVHVSVSISGHKYCTSSELVVEGESGTKKGVKFGADETMVVEYRDRLIPQGDKGSQAIEREFLRASGSYVEYPLPSTHVGRAKEIVSELTGKRIRFDWPKGDRDCRITVVGNVPEEWAQRASALLRPSCSAEFLNPGTNKATGESWDVPVVALRDLVLNPSGDVMSFTAADNSAQKPFPSRSRVARWSSVTGTVKASLMKPESETQELARICISGELAFESTTPFVAGLPRASRGTEKMKIEGLAIWDTKHNRLDSILIDGTSEMYRSDDLVVERPTGPVPAEWHARAEARSRWMLVRRYESK